MASQRNYLFNANEWHSVNQALIQKMRDEIAGLESQRILNTPVEDLLAYFLNEYTLEVPVIQKDQAVADQNEKQIDVSHDYDRHWSTLGHTISAAPRSRSQCHSQEMGLYSMSDQLLIPATGP
jgi:hypothetical protein